MSAHPLITRVCRQFTAGCFGFKCWFPQQPPVCAMMVADGNSADDGPPCEGSRRPPCAPRHVPPAWRECREGDHPQMTARCLSRCRGHLYTSLVYQRQARISVPSITASASGVTFPRKNAMRCVHGSTRSSTTRAGVGLAIRRCLNA
jgi:hypothetical protein